MEIGTCKNEVVMNLIIFIPSSVSEMNNVRSFENSHVECELKMCKKVAIMDHSCPLDDGSVPLPL